MHAPFELPRAAPEIGPLILAEAQLSFPIRLLGRNVVDQHDAQRRKRLLIEAPRRFEVRNRKSDVIEHDGSLKAQTCRANIIFLISAIALAGWSPLGQTLVQFKIVWHR